MHNMFHVCVTQTHMKFNKFLMRRRVQAATDPRDAVKYHTAKSQS